MKGMPVKPALLCLAVLVVTALESSSVLAGAVEDLERLSGRKIDRPDYSYTPPPSRAPGYGTTQPGAQKTKRPALNTSTSVAAFTLGTMMNQIFDSFPDIDPQASVEARAMAEAEHRRLVEEQKRQRLISAERLRSFWDRADSDISSDLDDVFSLPGQSRGTDFFGVPMGRSPKGTARPAPQSDAPVTIGPGSAAPEVLGSGAPSANAGFASAPAVELPADSPPLQQGVMKGGLGYARGVAEEMVKDMVKMILPASERSAEMMVGYVDSMKGFTDELFKAIDPQRLVAAIAGGGPEDCRAILDDLDRVQRNASVMAATNSPFSAEELELGYKLLHHKDMTADEVYEAAGARLKSIIAEKLEHRLFAGAM
jgi:hypothetical protein